MNALLAPGPALLQRGEHEGSRWETALRPPSPALAPHVLRMVGYDERSSGPSSQRQFPASFVAVIVEFGPPLSVSPRDDPGRRGRHAGGFVAALGDDFAVCRHDGHQQGVQVDLTPTGARRLLGLPLRELDGLVVGLGDLFGRESERLSDRLASARSWDERLDLVEAFLQERILASTVDTARVDRAVARIAARRGVLEIRDLAAELGTSPKHLIAQFGDHVGVKPKLYARLVRFAGVMQEARGGAPRPWADLALEHGFYDQSHLVREVRHFTGLTPTEARRHLPDALAELFG